VKSFNNNNNNNDETILSFISNKVLVWINDLKKNKKIYKNDIIAGFFIFFFIFLSFFYLFIIHLFEY
jgi:hypothetical protein